MSGSDTVTVVVTPPDPVSVTVLPPDETSTVATSSTSGQTSVTPPSETETVYLEQGIPGPPGPAGVTESLVYNVKAGQALSGQRVVVVENGLAVYADPTLDSHRDLQPLLTLGALASGDSGSALAFGTASEVTWAWTTGVPLYVGPNGALTETPPVGVAWLRIVASASAPDSLFFDPRIPIVLSN